MLIWVFRSLEFLKLKKLKSRLPPLPGWLLLRYLQLTMVGCLPVVFDDAFVNSDPGRIKLLQGMRDLAASKGLQVLVLTCNLSVYAGVGGEECEVWL